jgi:hypothetical protein
MAEQVTLTVLYTAALRGDLGLLPRLASLMRHHAALPGAGRVVRLDLGGACHAASWHCAATDGRSMLLALDAIGYDAARTDGYLSEAGRAHLLAMGDSLHIALMGDAGHWRVAPSQAGQPPLAIALTPADAGTHILDGVLHLSAVGGGQLGLARCAVEKDQWTVSFTGVFHVRTDTPPDTSIAGIVDLIAAEARAAQKRRANPAKPSG